MGTEAFYATAAQVLPAILIAITIEIGLVLRRPNEELSKLDATWGNPPPVPPGLARLYGREKDPTFASEIHEKQTVRTRDAIDNWHTVAALITGAFGLGEALAFAAIGYRLFDAWTFYGVATCLVAMCVAAAVIPLWRLNRDYGR